MPRLRSYVLGYMLSVLLTLMAFGVAYLHIRNDHTLFSHENMVFVIVALAIAQLLVQAVCFLHLSKRSNERQNLVAFIFTIFIVLFIGVGSLWIMDNLNRNMSPEEVGAYLHKEN